MISMPEIGVLAKLNPEKNVFAPIAELGLRTAQLQNWEMSYLTEEVAQIVRKQLRESGIHLAAFWAGYSGKIIWNPAEGPGTCGLVPKKLRERRVAELKQGAEFAAMLGVPAIITHCGFIPEDPRNRLYGETINAIRDVASYCQKLGLEFWFETGQETPLTLLRAIEDVALTNLGVNLDTANLILYGRGNPVDALDVIGPYVRNLHVKDGIFPVSGRELGKEVPLGKGKADLPKIIRKLRALEFAGQFIIEREISGPKQEHDIRLAVRKLTPLLTKYYAEK